MSPLKDYRKPHMCRIPVLAFKNYYSGTPVLRDRFTAGSRAKREAWPGDALSCFAFSDDYSFGILQSGIHWSWFIATCSKLKGDFRYTPESVFDTFPWPQKPKHEDIKAVAEAAVTLRALRQETMRKLNYSLPPRAIFRLVFSV
jgi:hypothetical protein